MYDWDPIAYFEVIMYLGMTTELQQDAHPFEDTDDVILCGVPICCRCGRWDWNLIHERPQISVFDALDRLEAA